jgi:DNA integrity scanning protein DisA with diadenylate cyclase activity
MRNIDDNEQTKIAESVKKISDQDIEQLIRLYWNRPEHQLEEYLNQLKELQQKSVADPTNALYTIGYKTQIQLITEIIEYKKKLSE